MSQVKKQQQNLTAIIRDKKGRILSIGKNSYVKTHPFQAKMARSVGRDLAVFLHAEIAAIVACSDISKAYSIEVIRTMKDGSLGLAKPCNICMRAFEKIIPNIKIIHS